MTKHIVALDLFAGSGWGVACQRLGITEKGVENMPEAVATRTLNGMDTVYNDAWDADKAAEIGHDIQLASPPCQAFSVAGSGRGRQALNQVLGIIDAGRWRDLDELASWSNELGDDRIGLVLLPLHYAVRYRPQYIAWEQVPSVLPVWGACADALRSEGYSVKTAVLSAEEYGVPQTRKRAILVARLDGEVSLPTPTHSKYYPRDPCRLDDGVAPWVSMEEALGVGETHRGGLVGTNKPDGIHYQSRGHDLPAQTITGQAGSYRWAPAQKLVSNYGTGGDYAKRGERSAAQPAQTITSKADRMQWKWWDRPATTVAGDTRITAREHHNYGEQAKTSLNLTPEEAARLQTFPSGFVFAGTKTKRVLQIGNAVPPLLAEHVLVSLTGPPGGTGVA